MRFSRIEYFEESGGKDYSVYMTDGEEEKLFGVISFPVNWLESAITEYAEEMVRRMYDNEPDIVSEERIAEAEDKDIITEQTAAALRRLSDVSLCDPSAHAMFAAMLTVYIAQERREHLKAHKAK